MNEKIWLSAPHLCGKELEFVQDAFQSNWIAPLGPYVDGFENDLCAFTKSKYAAALSSGTAALHLALIVNNVRQNDVVICPSFTFSASANPVLYQNATPVFVDSENETWNLDPVLLKTAIENSIHKKSKPKAIIVVHLYGMPAHIDEIFSVAQHYDIPVIEDAAESLGSMYKSKHTGTFGRCGILSFNGNKIITTSGGGALISDDASLTEKTKFLATQAREKAAYYQHEVIGYNYRLSNICAAIGRGQMTVLEKRIEKRRNIFEFYKKQLSGIDGISFLQEPENFFCNRWLTCILIDEKKAKGITPEHLRIALQKKNIDARRLWKPLHRQPVFQKYEAHLNGVSDSCFARGLCLPSGSGLQQEELNLIVQSIKYIFE